MSIGSISSTRERCIVGKFSGYHAILELTIESIKLGIFRVHRYGARDSQRVVEAGASIYRIETIENLCHLLRFSNFIASSVGNDLYSGSGCF